MSNNFIYVLKSIPTSDKSPLTIESGEKIIGTADESITCDGCAPTWLSDDGGEISLCGVQSGRICQYISSTVSRLRFTNASEGDSGVYRCKTLSDPLTFQSVYVKGKVKFYLLRLTHCVNVL